MGINNCIKNKTVNYRKKRNSGQGNLFFEFLIHTGGSSERVNRGIIHQDEKNNSR